MKAFVGLLLLVGFVCVYWKPEREIIGTQRKDDMTIQRFRKRPVEIEALRWTGDNFGELQNWCGDHIARNAEGTLRLFVQANMAWLELATGEWVAKDRHGHYPIKDDVFMESYQAVTG